jgi:ATP-dependent DNA ligase
MRSAAARKLFLRARAEGWEGVLLKRIDAPYLAGKRTPIGER